MKVGLGPGDFVLDGHPAPPPQKKGNSPANFQSMSIVVKWLDGPGEIVLDGDHPPKRRMPIVAKRLDGSRCHLVGTIGR